MSEDSGEIDYEVESAVLKRLFGGATVKKHHDDPAKEDLRKLRWELGMTQRDVAERMAEHDDATVGTLMSWISDSENGFRVMSKERQLLHAEVLLREAADQRREDR